MGRYRGPLNKLARREGVDLNLKTAGSNAHVSLLRRIKIRPGQHGQKMQRKVSDYGRQLREKQKVKQLYGTQEGAFRRYYEKASAMEGITGELLLQQLERRLDNVVYRLGFAPTRAAARQLVNHGHIIVNERRVDIPSYQISIDDVIRLRTQSGSIPLVKKMLEDTDIKAPTWVTVKGGAGKVDRMPIRTDITDDIEEQLIVEYYSR